MLGFSFLISSSATDRSWVYLSLCGATGREAPFFSIENAAVSPLG
jgi:hypothetical protein